MFTLDVNTTLCIHNLSQSTDSAFFYYIACKELVNGVWEEGKIRIQLPNHEYSSFLPAWLKQRNLYLPKGTILYPKVQNKHFVSRLKPDVVMHGYGFPIASFEPLGEDVYFF